MCPLVKDKMNTSDTILPALTLVWMLVVLPVQHTAHATNVKKHIEQPVEQALEIEQKTQSSQVSWRDEKFKKSQELETLEKKLARLKAQKNQEVATNETLKKKVAEKKQELGEIDRLQGQITPFITGLLEKLAKLNAHDLPFLAEERTKRLSALTALNADLEAPVSEKFRKLMEALLIEAEYGQTIEVYQQTIHLDGEETLVNIFRLGRLRLFYQTLDKQQCGFFNTARKSWHPLPGTYLKTLQAAIDMGSKRKPVEILDLPLGRLVTR